MKAFQIIERLETVYHLIENECTGTPSEFASMIHISRRQLYEYIQYLKEYGIDIKYSRERHTFFVANDCQLKLNCKIEIISGNEEKHIRGGRISVNVGSAFFMHGTQLI